MNRRELADKIAKYSLVGANVEEERTIIAALRQPDAGPLVEALRCCEAELVTLKSRLSEPFRSNVAAAAKVAREALASYEAQINAATPAAPSMPAGKVSAAQSSDPGVAPAGAPTAAASETPETDAVAFRMEITCHPPGTDPEVEVTEANFTRFLERRLRAAEARIKELTKEKP